MLSATTDPTEGSAKATVIGVCSGVRLVQSRKKQLDAPESRGPAVEVAAGAAAEPATAAAAATCAAAATTAAAETIAVAAAVATTTWQVRASIGGVRLCSVLCRSVPFCAVLCGSERFSRSGAAGSGLGASFSRVGRLVSGKGERVQVFGRRFSGLGRLFPGGAAVFRGGAAGFRSGAAGSGLGAAVFRSGAAVSTWGGSFQGWGGRFQVWDGRFRSWGGGFQVCGGCFQVGRRFSGAATSMRKAARAAKSARATTRVRLLCACGLGGNAGGKTIIEFASTCCLDYATSLVAAPPTCPLAVGSESALGCDALEDRQFELEFLAAASPHLCAMLLAPEGDPDALDIPTPRTYAEAVSGPWASRWRAAMDSKMASYRSTGTHVDEVPPPGANVVNGMWIFRVKRPPGSPLVVKVHYVSRGFRQRKGVDFFQTFTPTPKMTTLRVLLHVAAQRDYKLHSFEFSTAFLQGSLHKEVWLRRPSAFIGTFPPRTQWRLMRPICGFRQAPREWHDTLRSTMSDLGFEPSSADPLMFGHRDLGELHHYLGLQITKDRDARTITLSQSHMVQQVLQRFELQHSTVHRTPLPVGQGLTGPFPDEPFEPSGPYAELVGCLMYLITCSCLDLAFPLSILALFVVPGRHRLVHWTASVRVAKYLVTTSGVGLVLGGRQFVVLTGHFDSSLDHWDKKAC
ncbi:unnamed protein product [Closterium sp. NIES-53]